MRNALFALALVAALPACYSTTVATGRPMSGTVITQHSHIFVYGLVGGHVTPPCSPAQIETKETFVDWLIGGFTGGLYTPRTVITACAADAGPPATASR